jgi:protein TonB
MTFISQRSPARLAAGIALAILFHLGLIYVLVVGLSTQSVEKSKTLVPAKIIVEAKPPTPAPPPPPPPPMTAPPPPYIPPPEVHIRQPPPTPRAITATTPEKPPAPMPAPTPGPVMPAVVAPPGPPSVDTASDCQKPPYPPVSRRLGEEGTVTLRFDIGVDGKVADSSVEQSSGFPRLDRAARDALATLCRFKPYTIEGKPTAYASIVKFRWQLQ